MSRDMSMMFKATRAGPRTDNTPLAITRPSGTFSASDAVRRGALEKKGLEVEFVFLKK